MKLKFILFVLGLATLLVLQSKVIMPLVYDVVSSDLFLEDSGDEANRNSSSTQMTNAAFNQCNTYVANEVLSEQTITFPKAPLNAFSLGNFQYVINADIDIQPTNTASFTRRYVCRIKYDGDEDSQTSNPDDWSIEGFSGLDNL